MKPLSRYLPMLALTLGACAGSTGAEYGRLSVLLTDEPGDVVSAWVTLDQIYLQHDDGERAGHRVDLLKDDVTVDLVTLADDGEGLVDHAAVTTGFYEQFHVVVTAACIVVEGEEDAGGQVGSQVFATPGFTRCGATDGALQAPSLDGTGTPVLLPGDGLQITGEQQILVLDFDVRESFGTVAGVSDSWVLNPVIRGSAIELTDPTRDRD